MIHKNEPKVGEYFYDEENALLGVLNKDLDDELVAEIHADSPFGVRLADALNALAGVRNPAAVKAVIEAAKNLCPSQPSFDDPRIEWVEVQIDRDDLKAFRDAVAALDMEP